MTSRATHPRLTAFLGVPLVRDGRTSGLIAMANREGGYNRREREALEALAPAVVEAFARKRAEEALKKAHRELELRVTARTLELSETVELLRAENIQRKNLEESLRDSEKRVRFFAAQCLTAQEQERKRIAGELHDSIAATLAAIKFRIETIAEQAQLGRTTPASFQNLIAMVGEANREVRRIMADLRPAVLDDLGIMAAISWFCREFEKTYSHIRLEKHFDLTEGDITDSLKTAIYRISQEALNNIAKHSRAGFVTIDLRQDENGLALTIRDDGRGFNLADTRRGLGLSIMKERTELSGGKYTIESAEGQGTVIRADWSSVV